MPFWRVLLVAVLTAGMISPAQAGFREQAKRIHDRLAGVPPSDGVLQQMEDALAACVWHFLAPVRRGVLAA